MSSTTDAVSSKKPVKKSGCNDEESKSQIDIKIHVEIKPLK
jgi:hypothetical protein